MSLFTQNLGKNNHGAGLDSVGSYLDIFVSPSETVQFINASRISFAGSVVGPFFLERLKPVGQDFREASTAGGNTVLVFYSQADLKRRDKRPKWRFTWPEAKIDTRNHIEWLYNRAQSFRVQNLHEWGSVRRQRLFASPGQGSTPTKWETHLPYLKDGSVTVWLDDTAQAAGLDYTLNTDSGVVTFTGSTLTGSVVEATYLRDVCCTITEIDVTPVNGRSSQNMRWDVSCVIMET